MNFAYKAYNDSSIKEVFAEGKNLGEPKRRTFYAVLGAVSGSSNNNILLSALLLQSLMPSNLNEIPFFRSSFSN